METVIPWFGYWFLVEFAGFMFGFGFGEAFSKLDGEIKHGAYKAWYTALGVGSKRFVAQILDAFHHFQYGILLMIAAHRLRALYPELAVALYAFGAGLVVSDAKDYQNVLKRFFGVGEEVKPPIPPTPP